MVAGWERSIRKSACSGEEKEKRGTSVCCNDTASRMMCITWKKNPLRAASLKAKTNDRICEGLVGWSICYWYWTVLFENKCEALAQWWELILMPFHEREYEWDSCFSLFRSNVFISCFIWSLNTNSILSGEVMPGTLALSDPLEETTSGVA